ncbi:MAG: hypothetical protein ACLR8Y_10140 [Alistipes indistinctus]
MTTYFRRGFTTPVTTVYSNTVCVTVVTVDPGSISGDQTVEDSQQPAKLKASSIRPFRPGAIPFRGNLLTTVRSGLRFPRLRTFPTSPNRFRPPPISAAWSSRKSAASIPMWCALPSP